MLQYHQRRFKKIHCDKMRITIVKMILISFANLSAVSYAGNMAGIINMGAILENLYQSPGNKPVLINLFCTKITFRGTFLEAEFCTANCSSIFKKTKTPKAAE